MGSLLGPGIHRSAVRNFDEKYSVEEDALKKCVGRSKLYWFRA